MRKLCACIVPAYVKSDGSEASKTDWSKSVFFGEHGSDQDGTTLVKGRIVVIKCQSRGTVNESVVMFRVVSYLIGNELNVPIEKCVHQYGLDRSPTQR